MPTQPKKRRILAETLMRELRAREKAAGVVRKQTVVIGRHLEIAKRLAREAKIDEQDFLGAVIAVGTALIEERGDDPEFRDRFERALDALAIARGKKSTNQTELELTPTAA